MEQLSEKEVKLLSYDYWFEKNAGHSKRPSTREFVDRFLRCCLDNIRNGYISVKASGNPRIIHLLTDEIAMSTLFQLAYAICNMHEFLNFLRTNMTCLPSFPFQESVGPSASEMNSSYVRPRMWLSPGSTPSFMHLRNILLIGKEILSQLGINPNVSINNSSDNESSNDASNSLMKFVEVGVKQLRSEIRNTDSQILNRITGTLSSYATDSSEYNACVQVAERVYKYSGELSRKLDCCGGYLGARDPYLFEAFQEVIRVINLTTDPWSGDRDYYFEKNMRCLEKIAKGKM